jgi:hypothetical protein
VSAGHPGEFFSKQVLQMSLLLYTLEAKMGGHSQFLRCPQGIFVSMQNTWLLFRGDNLFSKHTFLGPTFICDSLDKLKVFKILLLCFLLQSLTINLAKSN